MLEPSGLLTPRSGVSLLCLLLFALFRNCWCADALLYPGGVSDPTCLSYASNNTEGGIPFLQGTPDPWHSSSIVIRNSCFTGNILELKNYSTLSFEVRGELRNPTCVPTIRFNRCCNYGCSPAKAFTSANFTLGSLTPNGVLNLDTWQPVVVRISDFMNNAALNCDGKVWNLDRGGYSMNMYFNEGCPSPQNLVQIRNIKLSTDLLNLPPQVLSSPSSFTAPAEAVARLSANVSDDGLPAGTPLTTTWRVLGGPTGFSDSLLSDPTSPSTWLAFPSTALAGVYRIRFTVSDGDYNVTREFNVTLDTSSKLVSLSSPESPVTSQPFMALQGATINVAAVLKLNGLPGTSQSDMQWSSSSPSADTVTFASPNSLATTATLPATASAFNISFSVQLGPYTRTASTTVRTIASSVVRAASTWVPGERIPTTNTVRTQCSPRLQETATVHVVGGGDWSSLIPDGYLQADDCVLIWPGVSVRYDVQLPSGFRFRCLVSLGDLSFAADKDTSIGVSTIQIWPGGSFTIPPPQGDTKVNVVFSGSINTAEDPSQETLGLQAYDSSVSIIGQKRCGHRLWGTGMLANTTQIQVAGSADCWRAGDQVVFSDLQQGLNIDHWSFSFNIATQGQTEYRTVVTVGGTDTVTLDRPLRFSHRDSWVGMLTRSVTFRTNLADGTSRAHMFVAGNGALLIQYAAVIDMGRQTVELMSNTTFRPNCSVIQIGTNQIGRYPIHMHRTLQAGLVEGCAVFASSTSTLQSLLPRFGIVHHDTHASLLGNIVVGARGSGIFLENVTNTGLVKNNHVVGVGGGMGGADDGRFAPTLGGDMGAGGFGIWSRSALPRIENNSVDGFFSMSGYSFYVHNNHNEAAIFSNVTERPAEVIGKTYAQLGGSSIPFQRYGGFVDNTGQGSWRVGVEVNYATGQPPIGTLVQRLKLTSLSMSGRALSIIHGSKLTLDSCNFTAIHPGNTIVGVFKNNGLGSSVDLVNTALSGFRVALGTFPLGNNVTGSLLVDNVLDVGFTYTARGPDGDGAVFVDAPDGRRWRLFSNASSVPAGAVGEVCPVKTDAVACVRV